MTKKKSLFPFLTYNYRAFIIFAFIFLSLPIFNTHLIARDKEQIRKDAIELYYQKQYVEALELFDDYLREVPDDEEANVYYAECFSKNLETELLIEKAKKLRGQMRFNDALEVLYDAKKISPYLVEIEILIEKIEDEKLKAKPFEHVSPKEMEEYKQKFSLGLKNMDEGKNEIAMNLFARCLAIAPKSPEAIEAYNKANNLYKSQLHREKLYDIFLEADKYKANKQYVLAIAKYEEILRYDPSNNKARNEISDLNSILQSQREKSEKEKEAGSLMNSAKNFFNTREYDKAIEQFTLGKGVDPAYADWDGWIEKSRKSKEDYEKRIFEAKLKEIEAKYESALYYVATEKYSLAIAEFDEVYAISKKYGQKEMMQASLDFIHKLKDAIKQKEEEMVSDESPYYDLVATLTALGIKKFDDGQYGESKKYFENILDLFPKNKNANKYFILCNIKMQKGYGKKFLDNVIPQIRTMMKTDPNEARRLLDLAATVDPENDEVKKLQQEMGRKKSIETASKVPRTTLDGWYSQALGLSRSDPDKAKALCRNIIAADPDYIRAQTLLARINARTASTFLTSASDAIKPAAQKEYAQGMLNYNNGRVREAMNHFQRALQIDPGFAKARNAHNKCKVYLSSQ